MTILQILTEVLTYIGLALLGLACVLAANNMSRYTCKCKKTFLITLIISVVTNLFGTVYGIRELVAVSDKIIIIVLAVWIIKENPLLNANVRFLGFWAGRKIP